jgi:integrase
MLRCPGAQMVHAKCTKEGPLGKRGCNAGRKKIGQVSYFPHHGSWWVYYRDRQQGAKPIRKSVSKTESEARIIAAQLNAQLAASAPTLFSYTPITIQELQRRFIDYHDFVLRSSLATVSRYRAATRHLVNFNGTAAANELDVEAFVRYLRSLLVAPNGHVNSRRRNLRDKGVQYILETCRSMYAYAAKKRCMPPYADNPFSNLRSRRFEIGDAKRVFLFDQNSEAQFFRAADSWAFPLNFVLAKTGLRPGEASRLLIEEVDLGSGWLAVRNKPELGWRIKTRRERSVPLIAEVVLVLRRVIGDRQSGPVFLRERANRSCLPLGNLNFSQLIVAADKRIAAAERTSKMPLTRSQAAQVYSRVWRDTGAVRCDAIRHRFIRICFALSFPAATCPKSWRHTFATLLQDANVDPLIRQVTLGHATGTDSSGALGMTSIYTHTRPTTQKREIDRAMQLWPDTLQVAQEWATGVNQ